MENELRELAAAAPEKIHLCAKLDEGMSHLIEAGADVVATYLTGIREPGAELPQLFFTPGVRMSRYFAETYARADGVPVADPCVATAVLR